MSFILLITYFLNEDTKSIWLALQNALILSLFYFKIEFTGYHNRNH